MTRERMRQSSSKLSSEMAGTTLINYPSTRFKIVIPRSTKAFKNDKVLLWKLFDDENSKKMNYTISF